MTAPCPVLVCLGLPKCLHRKRSYASAPGLEARAVSLFRGANQDDGELELKFPCHGANLVVNRHWSRKGHAAARVSRLAYAALWRGAGLRTS